MPMFTWSLGCTGALLPTSPPSVWMARLEMTSFTFMLVCVPEPVWKVTSGKWSSSLPAITSSAAVLMAEATDESKRPYFSFTDAAHFLRMPKPGDHDARQGAAAFIV